MEHAHVVSLTPTPPSLKLNDVFLDRFVLLDSELGSGISGKVRLARDLSNPAQPHCAVKVVSFNHAGTNEIAMHAACSPHPNIVPLLGTCVRFVAPPLSKKAGLHHVMVMAAAAHGDVLQRVMDHGAMGEEATQAVMHQTMRAVYHMHGSGVAHVDFKPENLLISAIDPETQLLTVQAADFGFASDNPMLTERRGTPVYMAPEVVALYGLAVVPGQHYTMACDLWSLGVTMYTMLCATFPFQFQGPVTLANGNLNPNLMAAIQRGVYRDPRARGHAVSDDCIDFLQRLLTLDPAARMTAEEALAHPWLMPLQQPVNDPFDELMQPQQPVNDPFDDEAAVVAAALVNDLGL